jgi:hypothetical protein
MYGIDLYRSNDIESCLFKTQAKATGPREQIYSYWLSNHRVLTLEEANNIHKSLWMPSAKKFDHFLKCAIGIPQLTLPNNEKIPTLLSQLPMFGYIPCPVSFDFRTPIPQFAFRSLSGSASVSMPKTTVDENR